MICVNCYNIFYYYIALEVCTSESYYLNQLAPVSTYIKLSNNAAGRSNTTFISRVLKIT
jgi:hypothetical protein